jgi:hypothetical protein
VLKDILTLVDIDDYPLELLPCLAITEAIAGLTITEE